jgi:hypothetical protein
LPRAIQHFIRSYGGEAKTITGILGLGPYSEQRRKIGKNLSRLNVICERKRFVTEVSFGTAEAPQELSVF